MKTFNLIRLALQLACTTLVITATTIYARDFKASSGNNFTLTPTATPGVFTLTHPGVAQLSVLGNCTFDGEEILISPSKPGEPLLLKGTFRFTSADGTSTLTAEAEGTGTPDPANPNFVTLRYSVKFTGGTGQMAHARGSAKLHGVAMLTSPTSGTTTFVMQGEIFTREHDNQHEKD